MANQKLFDSINAVIQLTRQEEMILEATVIPRTFRKKQYLLHENQVCKYAAFVTSGCLRSFSIDNNGFEHILQFAPANWWIADMYSFISGRESNLIINAIIDSDVLLLSRENQLKLFDEIPKLERYFRIITERSLVSSHQRLLDNMSTTAKERYQKFCNTYPTLVNKLPQKQIASFIGITPEFLSRIRSESIKKSDD